MKRSIMLAVFAAALCVALPLTLLPGRPGGTATEPGTLPLETQPEPISPGTDESLTIRVRTESGVIEMNLQDYLVGVLLGEMPMDFADEALKAQAVVCRTYTLRRSGSVKHDDADICTDSTCCQAWQDSANYPESARARALAAIKATDGQVLLYDGALIDATFFSSSGGRTEAAVAVWGADIPYLQAVDSPGEQSPYNEDQVIFSPDAFRRLLLTQSPEADLTGSPESWFGGTVYSPGGGVASMTIGGVTFSGTALRKLLSLRSTVFTVTASPDKIVICTQGFGHRVGMSQYGAQAMALAGKGYAEILLYYYTGVELTAYCE